MLPADFIEYSKAFDFGFLSIVRDGGPSIEFVDFEVRREYVKIKTNKEISGKGCLVFANERYSENSLMAQVIGDLVGDEEGYKLIPLKAFWTYPFTLDSHPAEIVKRWRR